MSDKSEMARKYSELAPQFLAFLASEAERVNAQLDRMKKSGSSGEEAGEEENESAAEDVGQTVETPDLLNDESEDSEAEQEIV